MILNYYAIKCNGLVYANYQTLEGAQKGLVERARYLQEKQRVCIENVTSRSFDADWYGGHANWKIVEVTLELL